jgi:predicted ArsR family transcriptional regulator
VGRAPRVYEPAAVEVEVRLPDRSPELLADILIAAVLAEHDGENARAAAIRVAGERGRSLGAEARQRLRGRLGAERALSATADVLAAAGYEPYACPGPGLRLGNCPFHPLAQREPALVCGLNHAYLAGFLDELGAGDRLDAELAPRPGECCVEVRPR